MMNTLQQVIVMMAITDTQWKRARRGDGRREMTTAELDALADFDWPWSGPTSVIAACARAVQSRWRSGAIGQPETRSLAPAETT